MALHHHVQRAREARDARLVGGWVGGWGTGIRIPAGDVAVGLKAIAWIEQFSAKFQ